MHVIAIILIGLVAGVIAKLIMPGKDPGGLIVTLIIGVAGSLLAGMLGWSVGGKGPGLIASVIGALILLSAYRIAMHRREIN